MSSTETSLTPTDLEQLTAEDIWQITGMATATLSEAIGVFAEDNAHRWDPRGVGGTYTLSERKDSLARALCYRLGA
jgi:hypothetical protein